MDETESSTNVKRTMWMKLKRRQMAYLQCGRSENVDKWHTYNVDETESSTNVKLTMWMKRKR